MRVIDYALSLPFCKDVIVSGHSQGGLTTVLAAGLMSDKVKAAMPMSPALNIWDGARKGKLFGFRFDPDHVPAEAPTGNGVNGNYLRAAAMLPVKEAVARFKKPVLVVHGTADDGVPFKWGQWLKERYEDARLVPIEGDDHCYNMHLDMVLEKFIEFMNKKQKKNLIRIIIAGIMFIILKLVQHYSHNRIMFLLLFYLNVPLNILYNKYHVYLNTFGDS